jgi:dTDP-4-dehydrorhamnose 3,5-epimerase
MDFQRLDILDVILITPREHADSRGFFSETFRADFCGAQGLDACQFVQDNHVYSTQKGVLRGLHFQLKPHDQGKLVRCTRGAIFDVPVDLGQVRAPTGVTSALSYQLQIGSNSGCHPALGMVTLRSKSSVR